MSLLDLFLFGIRPEYNFFVKKMLLLSLGIGDLHSRWSIATGHAAFE